MFIWSHISVKSLPLLLALFFFSLLHQLLKGISCYLAAEGFTVFSYRDHLSAVWCCTSSAGSIQHKFYSKTSSRLL